MIVVDDVWKSFGSHEVLKGLSLTVNEGETLVILGRSGVGKSVLLKHLLGLEIQDRGSIKIKGVEPSSVSQIELHKSIGGMGMLFQGAALFDSMSVGLNVGFYLHEHGDLLTGETISPDEIDRRVALALDMVDLKGTESKMPSDLSGGMKKRAALARLIVYRPKILLYDEPTTGLDPITAMQINELIVQIQKDLGATSIVVTHDIPSALFVGDRMALHHQGQIKYIDDKENFMKIDDPLIHQFIDSSVRGINLGGMRR
jgi:phospholipid/cholesterol/gamma-HCH transport system ATP-binding protein